MKAPAPASAGAPPSRVPSLPARSAAKRRQILEAGRRVFLEHGFAGASMDLVAATAGVSKATIYSHFGRKQDLLSAIVNDVSEQILAMEVVVPQAAESTEAALTELAVSYARVLFDPEVLALVRLAIGENRHYKDLGRGYYLAGPARARDGLAGLLGSLCAAGKLAIGHLELAADQFIALIQPERYYVLLDPGMTPPPGEIERIARTGVEVFLSHYSTRRRH